MTVQTQTLSVPASAVPDIEARRTYPEVTDEIDAALRELVDEVIVPGGKNSTRQVMHIPDEAGEKLCQGRDFSGITKDTECYPRGYRTFCGECAARARLRHGGVVDAQIETLGEKGDNA